MDSTKYKTHNLFFPEDAQTVDLDNFFKCLQKDQGTLLKHLREADYKKVCFIVIRGVETDGADETKHHKFKTFQTGIRFVNTLNDTDMYQVSSTLCEDSRVIEIYSYYLAQATCNILTVETKIAYSALPVTPGIVAIAPTQSIKMFLDKHKGE